MPNQYFMDNFANEHKAWSEKSDEEKSTIREKNRLARVVIANGKCLSCDTPLQTFRGLALSASCSRCGANISEFAYMDKF